MSGTGVVWRPSAPAALRHALAPGPASRYARADTPLAVLVFCVTLGVMLTGISRPSVWFDEAITRSVASRSWAQISLVTSHVDAVHAAYYRLMHLWFHLVPDTDFTLRFPSAVAFGVAAVAIFFIGRELSGRCLGLFSAALALCSTGTTTTAATAYGIEGRGYALALALSSLTILATLLSLTRSGWWLIAVGVLLTLNAWLFLYSLLLVPALLITFAVARRWRLFVAFAATSVAVTASALPLVVEAAKQRVQIDWLSWYDQRLWSRVLSQWFPQPLAVISWCMVAIGLCIVISQRRSTTARLLFAVTAPVLVVPAAILVTATLLGFPTFVPRYVLFALPAPVVLMGVCIIKLPQWRYQALAVTVLLALAVPSYAQIWRPDGKGVVWKQTAAFLQVHSRPGDALATLVNPREDSSVSTQWLPTAYPQVTHSVNVLSTRPEAAELGQLGDPLVDVQQPGLLGGRDRLWVAISSRSALASDDTYRYLERSGFRPTTTRFAGREMYLVLMTR